MSLEDVLTEMAKQISSLRRDLESIKTRSTGGMMARGIQDVIISGGELDVNAGAFYSVNPESGTSDDLDTINNGVGGKIITLRTTTGNTITLKHGTGNLSLLGSADFTLDDTNIVYTLIYDDAQSKWIAMDYFESASSTPTAVAGRINLGSLQSVTLATGSFALVSNKSFYEVNAESGTADDLENITGGADGDLIVIRPASGDTITTVETGNLDTDGGKTLDGTNDKLMLIYDSAISKWCQVSWAGN